jgi:hypothetical protein
VNEFHDPELERTLGRVSGAYPDANVALEAVRGRVRRAKRRRAMAASTAACVLLAGVVALAVRGGDSGRVQPSHFADTSTSVEVVRTTPSTEPSTRMTEMTTDTSVEPTIETTIDASNGMTGVGSGSPDGSGTHSGKPTTTSRSGTAGASSNASNNTNDSGATTTTAPAAAPVVQPTTPTEPVTTYSSKGGSVSVQLVKRRMVLVGTAPVAGFTVHLNEVSSDRIRVEFTNGSSTYEMQLEMSNGTITSSGQIKGP